MPASRTPPKFPDERTRWHVRDALEKAGYREAKICSSLGVTRWQNLAALEASEFRARVAQLPPPRQVLLELFNLRLSVERSKASDGLGRPAVDAMESAGLLGMDGTQVVPRVALAPVEDLIFASDLMERHRNREADFVLGAGGSTRRLADLTLRDPVRSVLDLGCGAGVLGGLAASHADRVVATDISARAVSFSRFNAELNGLGAMDCREGSLFEPVRGERFDLIVCNPPYVISPHATFIYRDGGTDLCRSIVHQVRDHLTPSGTLQMMVEWPEREGQDWRDEVTNWLDGTGCHAWLLRLYSEGADRYAARWLMQEYGGEEIPEAATREWTDHLRGLGIASVGGGHLVLRPAKGLRPHAELRVAPPLVGPTGAALGQWLRCQEFLLALRDDTTLLDTVLAPSPDLERTDRRTPTGQGWRGDGSELRLRSGLTFGARVDPVATEMVGLLDGRRTPREALRAFGQDRGVSVVPFVAGLPGALRRLVALGLLVPAA